jgi:hypothetical protein
MILNDDGSKVSPSKDSKVMVYFLPLKLKKSKLYSSKLFQILED